MSLTFLLSSFPLHKLFFSMYTFWNLIIFLPNSFLDSRLPLRLTQNSTKDIESIFSSTLFSLVHRKDFLSYCKALLILLFSAWFFFSYPYFSYTSSTIHVLVFYLFQFYWFSYQVQKLQQLQDGVSHSSSTHYSASIKVRQPTSVGSVAYDYLCFVPSEIAPYVVCTLWVGSLVVSE